MCITVVDCCSQNVEDDSSKKENSLEWQKQTNKQTYRKIMLKSVEML